MRLNGFCYRKAAALSQMLEKNFNIVIIITWKGKNTDHVDGVSNIWKMLSKSINTTQILKTMTEKNYRVAVTKNKQY